MKNTCLLLIAIILLASCLAIVNPVSATPTEDTWTSKAPMPTAMAYIRIATINDTLYTIGSSYDGFNEKYNTTTDMWATGSSMPNPGGLFAMAACEGKIYCFGGEPTGFIGALNANRVYDPRSNSWENKAAIPTARYGMQAQAVSGKIYLIGGKTLLGYNLGFEALNVTEIYDPASDIWSTGSPIPDSTGCVSAVVDGKIFVIGSTTQIYDPKTDNWSVGASPPQKIVIAADSAAAAATTGTFAPKRIYVYDGSSLHVYNPQADQWTNSTAPPTSRQGLAIGVADDRLYFVGGLSYPIPEMGIYYIFSAANEEYTPLGYGTTVETPSYDVFLLGLVASLIVVVAVAGMAIFLKKHKRLGLSLLVCCCV